MIDSGIYKIKIGPYFYWGQSSNLVKRQYEHMRTLSLNEHSNPKMQNVYNKYQTFEFVVVDELIPEPLDDQEQMYLDLIYGDEYCLNLSRDAQSVMRGRSHSDETKKLMSSKKQEIYDGDKNPFYGKTHTESSRKKMSQSQSKRSGSPHSRQVTISYSGKVMTFDSVTAAGRHLGVAQSTINGWITRGTKPKQYPDLVISFVS